MISYSKFTIYIKMWINLKHNYNYYNYIITEDKKHIHQYGETIWGNNRGEILFKTFGTYLKEK